MSGASRIPGSSAEGPNRPQQPQGQPPKADETGFFGRILQWIASPFTSSTEDKSASQIKEYAQQESRTKEAIALIIDCFPPDSSLDDIRDSLQALQRKTPLQGDFVEVKKSFDSLNKELFDTFLLILKRKPNLSLYAELIAKHGSTDTTESTRDLFMAVDIYKDIEVAMDQNKTDRTISIVDRMQKLIEFGYVDRVVELLKRKRIDQEEFDEVFKEVARGLAKFPDALKQLETIAQECGYQKNKYEIFLVIFLSLKKAKEFDYLDVHMNQFIQDCIAAKDYQSLSNLWHIVSREITNPQILKHLIPLRKAIQTLMPEDNRIEDLTYVLNRLQISSEEMLTTALELAQVIPSPEEKRKALINLLKQVTELSLPQSKIAQIIKEIRSTFSSYDRTNRIQLMTQFVRPAEIRSVQDPEKAIAGISQISDIRTYAATVFYLLQNVGNPSEKVLKDILNLINKVQLETAKNYLLEEFALKVLLSQPLLALEAVQPIKKPYPPSPNVVERVIFHCLESTDASVVAQARSLAKELL